MSAEKNIEDNTSNKEVLSDKSKSITGDVYVQDVHKYFGVTRALNGVNFNANFGEIHAIVGGNGCMNLAKICIKINSVKGSCYAKIFMNILDINITSNSL